ncbi:MAG TPA: methyltransferase domain-containing protein [Pseudomonadales bacterium]|nr:methyltransferase domain-containing protein [Pseudomonadales bacterium]
MAATTPSTESVAGARAYEQLHVPALFRPWAEALIAEAEPGPGERILDLACGTGILARTIAARTGDPTRITGVDADPGMLAVAAERAPEVRWLCAGAETLPFADASFERVFCQFGLMFFTDRQAGLREMRRVLRPGGRLHVAVWDAVDRSPPWDRLVPLLDRLAGRPAAEALAMPFCLGDRDALADLCARSGLDDAEIETLECRAAFPGIRALVGAELHGWLPLMGVHLEAACIDACLQAADEELADLLAADGTLAFTSRAHRITVQARP